MGCGASALWTAQGRLILEYASRAEELLRLAKDDDDDGGAGTGTAASSPSFGRGRASSSSSSSSSSSQTGELMGTFWSIFQCSSIVGGSVSLLYYGRDDGHVGRTPRGSIALYALFLIFIVIGASSTRLLMSPNALTLTGDGPSATTTMTTIRDDGKVRAHDDRRDDAVVEGGGGEVDDDVEMIADADERSSLLVARVADRSTTVDGMMRERTAGKNDVGAGSFDDDMGRDTWTKEAMGTLRLFLTREMMCLSPLFFYTVRAYHSNLKSSLFV